MRWALIFLPLQAFPWSMTHINIHKHPDPLPEAVPVSLSELLWIAVTVCSPLHHYLQCKFCWWLSVTNVQSKICTIFPDKWGTAVRGGWESTKTFSAVSKDAWNVSGTWGTDFFRQTGHNLSFHLPMQLLPGGSKAMDSAPRPAQVFSYAHNLSLGALPDLAGDGCSSVEQLFHLAPEPAVLPTLLWQLAPGWEASLTPHWCDSSSPLVLAAQCFLIPALLHPLFVTGPTITRVIHTILLLQEIRLDCCTEISLVVADAGCSNAEGK